MLSKETIEELKKERDLLISELDKTNNTLDELRAKRSDIRSHKEKIDFKIDSIDTLLKFCEE